jgi:hypothetical protein
VHVAEEAAGAFGAAEGHRIAEPIGGATTGSQNRSVGQSASSWQDTGEMVQGMGSHSPVVGLQRCPASQLIPSHTLWQNQSMHS